ncbi:MAG TPA: cyclic nucleotide-binding domain-containing protein [Myxococcales bacterium]|nr:cyclic nucleotide-binding domain-containing protein [Myxococcales bacterium]
MESDLPELLGHLPFFAGLWDRGLEWVARTLHERSASAGTDVFREGEPGCSLFVIKSGELLATKGGRELMRLRAGDFFGETTLLEMQPRPFTAHVVGDAILYELSNRDLYQLYKEDVKAYVLVLQNINRELCRRLRTANRTIANHG